MSSPALNGHGFRRQLMAWSDAVPDERVEHLPHRFWVAAHVRGGGLDVADGIKVLPGEREPGVAGELPEEGTLRPPVALTERMQCVDLAQVIGQPPDEDATVQAAQAVFIAQLAEDDGRGGNISNKYIKVFCVIWRGRVAGGALGGRCSGRMAGLGFREGIAG